MPKPYFIKSILITVIMNSFSSPLQSSTCQLDQVLRDPFSSSGFITPPRTLSIGDITTLKPTAAYIDSIDLTGWAWKHTSSTDHPFNELLIPLDGIRQANTHNQTLRFNRDILFDWDNTGSVQNTSSYSQYINVCGKDPTVDKNTRPSVQFIANKLSARGDYHKHIQGDFIHVRNGALYVDESIEKWTLGSNKSGFGNPLGIYMNNGTLKLQNQLNIGLGSSFTFQLYGGENIIT
ncbi:MAG: hypothetical protein ACPG5T_10055, partial [Endozoicomonas sp.]